MYQLYVLVELLGRYSKQDITSRLQRLLAGSASDRPPARPTRSVRRLRRLTESEVDELVERYQNGCSMHTLARDFEIHRTTVSAQLKARGVWKPPTRLTAEQTTQFVRLYKEGQSLARLAERFTVSQSTVSRILKEAGVTSRPVRTNQWSARS